MLSKEVKVGAFVLAGLSVMGLTIFVLGDSRRLFERHTEYQAVFDDVQGLGRGSPVRMGGLDVGSVKAVNYASNPSDSKLYVTLSIVKEEALRIRADSTATIAGKGLLGDKMVVITLGQPNTPELAPGSTIPSVQPEDFSNLMSKLGSIGSKAETLMVNLEKTSSSLAEPAFREDLQGSMAALRKILDSVASGQGYANRLLTDPAEAERLSNTVANLERSSAQLERVFAGLATTVDRVNQGPGLLHEVVYGQEGAEAIANMGAAADEAQMLLKSIREQGGDKNIGRMLADLNAMSEDLKSVTNDLRAGRGTLGALLKDPSVYEDVKVLLGNVQRNEALRALVRYSIKRDERATPVQDTDLAAGSVAAPAAAPRLEVGAGSRAAAGDTQSNPDTP